MLDSLKRFFNKVSGESSQGVPATREHDVRVATCALLVEIARIDETFTEEELETVLTKQDDPRMRGSDIFDSYPRCMHMRPQLGGFAESCEYNTKYF